jgi:uncharacterized membrane protein/ribosomal protein L40E
MTVESNRMMGGIGAVLIVFNAISPVLMLPSLFNKYPTIESTLFPFSTVLGLASFVGLILFLVAMRRFAGSYKTSGIFDNALYGVLSTIVVSVLAVFVVIAVVLMNFSNIISSLNPAPTPINIQSTVGYMLPVLPLFTLGNVIQALFLTRAFNLLATKSETPQFKNAGWALIASSVLTLLLTCVAVLLFIANIITSTFALVMPVAGTPLLSIAWIFPAKAFFAIKTPSQMPPTTQATAQTRYCPHCGAENLSDAVFCTRCGKKL